MITPIQEQMGLEDCVSVRNDINNFELNEKLAHLLVSYPDDLSKHIHQAAKEGASVSNQDYFKALETVFSLREAFARLFEKYELYITCYVFL